MKLIGIGTALGLLSLVIVGCMGRPAASGGDAAASPPPPAEDVSALTACQNSVIEDAEDGDGQITAADGRGGYWYTYTENHGSTVDPQKFELMTKGGAAQSQLSAKVSGTVKGGEGYVGAGFSLSEAEKPYDASKYKGISFWVKGTGSVRFSILDGNQTDKGGVCGTEGHGECFNGHGEELELTAEWKQYKLSWGALRQEDGWGNRTAFDPTKLFNVQWQAKRGSFELHVDEIAFLCAPGSAPVGAAPAKSAPAAPAASAESAPVAAPSASAR